MIQNVRKCYLITWTWTETVAHQKKKKKKKIGCAVNLEAQNDDIMIGLV